MNRNQLVSSSRRVSWNNFIVGETQLECETQSDQDILIKVCKENDIDCDQLEAGFFKYEPYFHVNTQLNCLESSKYSCDDDQIFSSWTVQEFIENHKY